MGWRRCKLGSAICMHQSPPVNLGKVYVLHSTRTRGHNPLFGSFPAASLSSTYNWILATSLLTFVLPFIRLLLILRGSPDRRYLVIPTPGVLPNKAKQNYPKLGQIENNLVVATPKRHVFDKIGFTCMHRFIVSYLRFLSVSKIECATDEAEMVRDKWEYIPLLPTSASSQMDTAIKSVKYVWKNSNAGRQRSSRYVIKFSRCCWNERPLN